MFKSTIITLLTLAMAFGAMAAPVPVPAAGMVVDAVKRDAVEIREAGAGGGVCRYC